LQSILNTISRRLQNDRKVIAKRQQSNHKAIALQTREAIAKHSETIAKSTAKRLQSATRYASPQANERAPQESHKNTQSLV
jgi:hypothetical protein